MNNYDIDYFIAKFIAIPDAQWCVELQINESGQRCALGHCQKENRPGNWDLSEEANALQAICFAHYPSFGIVQVNNGRLNDYPQPTPKQRVLAFLRDMKARAESALDEYELRPLTLTPAKEQVSV